MTKEVVMRKCLLTSLLATSLATVGLSQPYGWFPGSTVLPSSKTGDRVVIVDLGAGSIVGPSEGWDYTDASPGADTHVPGFSPDGKFVYLVNGGDGDAAEPNGHIYVYSTEDVIAKLAAAETPNGPVDIETIASSDEDAIEPVGLTVSPLGDRVYLVEGKEQKLHVFDVTGDGSLDILTSIDLGDRPSPMWLSADGTRGYLCSFLTGAPADPSLQVIDLAGDSPSVLENVDIPLPAQSNLASFPFVSCGFSMPAGTSTTVVPFPNVAPADDSLLYIWSGYTGFRLGPFAIPRALPLPSGDTYINDPVNIYTFDTGAAMMQGDPLLSYDPAAEQILFPPFIHAYESAAGDTFVHTGGSLMLRPGTFDVLETPNPSTDDLVLNYGMMDPSSSSFYIGSLSKADALSFVTTQSYDPSRDTSILYRYDLPTISRGVPTELVAVTQVDRATNFVLGYAGTDTVVVGASDTFFVARPNGSVSDPADARNTQVVLFDISESTEDTITLDLVAGAYGQQPLTVDVPNEIPVVTVASPAGDTTVGFAENAILFSGTASDPDGTVSQVLLEVNGGGFQAAAGTTTWMFNVPLDFGLNVVEVKAVDNAGSESLVVTRNVTRELPPNQVPAITISEPDSDQIIENSQTTFDFAGAATDDDTVTEVVYTVNGGARQTASGTTNWSFTATGLEVGNNIIEVIAIDNDTSESTPASRTIRRLDVGENLLPTVVITEPASNQTIPNAQTTFDFAGTANDQFGTVTMVVYTVNGGERFAASGTTNWSFTAEDLQVGANTISVIAIDNETSESVAATRTITRQALNQAPTIVVTNPAGDQMVSAGTDIFSFSGTANDPDGSIVLVEYSKNGGPFIVASGTTNWSFTAELDFGENVFVIRAVDNNSTNSNEVTRIITREADNQLPTITVTSPTSGITVPSTQTSVNTAGVANDPDGTIASVQFRVNGGAFQSATGTTSWTATVPLVPGSNTIQFKSVDNVGGESSLATITVHRLVNEPVDLLVLTEFKDTWGSVNRLGTFQTPDRIDFIGFEHFLPEGKKTLAGDVNGDGVTDFIHVNVFHEAWVAINGGAFSAESVQRSSLGWTVDTDANQMVFAGDFDGDGFVDLAQIDGTGNISVGFNNGGVIPAPGAALDTDMLFDVEAGFWIGVADMNNDGNDDLVMINNNANGQITVATGSDTGFDAPVVYGNTGFRYDPSAGVGIHFGDFDGDGFDDVLQIENKVASVALNSGGGTIGAGQQWGIPGFHDDPAKPNTGWWNFAGDVDGDGLDDVIQVNGFGEVWVARSLGDFFANPTKNAALGFEHMPQGRWQVFTGNAVNNN